MIYKSKDLLIHKSVLHMERFINKLVSTRPVYRSKNIKSFCMRMDLLFDVLLLESFNQFETCKIQR